MYIFLLTGCNASQNSGELAGIIAGSIFACLLFIGAIVGIVYCAIKALMANEAKKQHLMNKFDKLDYRTVVVRRMPPVPVGHSAVLRYSNAMFNYQPAVHSIEYPKVPISNMATISHLPIQRRSLVAMSYSTSRPRKSYHSEDGEIMAYRQSKRKNKTKSKALVSSQFSDFKSLGHSTDLTGRNSQFILRKKEDSSSDSDTAARFEPKLNEPYRLTSLFSRDTRSSQNPESRDVLAAKDETVTLEMASGNDLPSMNSYQPNDNLMKDQQRTSFRYSPESRNIPGKSYSDNTDPERPITPDYDVNSILDGEDENSTSFTDRNKFSYAAIDDLKKNSQFQASGFTTENPGSDLFGSTSKQVQFNPLSSDGESSSIKTSLLNPGTYNSIPPAPPLPES